MAPSDAFATTDPPRVSFTIARERRDAGPLDEQAERLLRTLPDALPQSRVVARRTRKVGTLSGYEARLSAKTDGASLYQRIAFVSYYDTLLVLTTTALAAYRDLCDRSADAWLEGFRFESSEVRVSRRGGDAPGGLDRVAGEHASRSAQRWPAGRERYACRRGDVRAFVIGCCAHGQASGASFRGLSSSTSGT